MAPLPPFSPWLNCFTISRANFRATIDIALHNAHMAGTARQAIYEYVSVAIVDNLPATAVFPITFLSRGTVMTRRIRLQWRSMVPFMHPNLKDTCLVRKQPDYQF